MAVYLYRPPSWYPDTSGVLLTTCPSDDWEAECKNHPAVCIEMLPNKQQFRFIWKAPRTGWTFGDYLLVSEDLSWKAVLRVAMERAGMQL